LRRSPRRRGHTSGSTHWLTSWAMGHVAASGLSLGGEQKRTGWDPDTCQHQTLAWSLTKALSFSCLGNPGPYCGRSGPHVGGGPDSIPRTRLAHVVVPDLPGGPGCIPRGPVLSHVGPDLLLVTWSIPSFMDTWRLWTLPCGAVGRCCGP
jgi:hypothetical protein